MEQMMKRATIMGCACVITSRLTVDQIDGFRKYLPEVLKLTEETSGMELFSIGLDDGPGSILEKKATFSRTRTPDGMATITLLLDPEVEDKAELVRDKIGKSLLALERLEGLLLEKLEDLTNTIHRMDEMICRL